MSNKGVQPIGGLFLSQERRNRHSETPEGLEFDTGHHVIIFVNLLSFFLPRQVGISDQISPNRREQKERGA
jgi:hypothetical protein